MALFVAAIWIRTPSAWPTFPEWFVHTVTSLYRPQSQEQVADVEFGMFWAFSWAAILGFLGAIALGGRLRKRFIQGRPYGRRDSGMTDV